MKVTATDSFFKSLKQIGSIKSKYYAVRAWFKYHFTKNNFNIIKTVLKGYPWDYGYLYDLERVKIKEMADIVENCEFANTVYKNVAAAMRQIHTEYPKILGITFNGTSVVSMEEIYDKDKLWNIFDLIDIPSVNVDNEEIKPVE